MGIQLTAGMQQNLFSLQQTNKLMDLTQGRLATGKKVNSALDDPIAFFSAQGHNRRANDLAGRKDAMGEAIQTIKSANSGIEAITTLINAAKSLAQSAISETSTATAETLRGQYDATRTQLRELVDDSGYKGINLLEDNSIVVKFDATGETRLTITGFDANAGGATGLGITSTSANDWASVGGSAVTASQIEEDIAELDSAIGLLRTNASELSNNLSIITARQDFTDSMINNLETGANQLTNADMNEEGANMLMLQTRQALGTSSLSIASQAAQAVLRLF